MRLHRRKNTFSGKEKDLFIIHDNFVELFHSREVQRKQQWRLSTNDIRGKRHQVSFLFLHQSRFPQHIGVGVEGTSFLTCRPPSSDELDEYFSKKEVMRA